MDQKSKFEGPSRVGKIRKAANKRAKRRAKAFQSMDPRAWDEYVESTWTTEDLENLSDY